MSTSSRTAGQAVTQTAEQSGGQTVETARTSPLPVYGPETGLLVIDVQNDFTDPGGGLYVADAETVVPRINAHVAAARRAGATIAYTQDWHPAQTPHFAKDGGAWPVHCVRDTWGAEFFPGLVVDGPVIRKGVDGGDGYSGFSVRDPVSGEESATELGTLLAEAGAEHVIVTGLAGDVCVMATALDARARGLIVTVPLDTTRFVELQPGDRDRAIEKLREAGVHLTDG